MQSDARRAIDQFDMPATCNKEPCRLRVWPARLNRVGTRAACAERIRQDARTTGKTFVITVTFRSQFRAMCEPPAGPPLCFWPPASGVPVPDCAMRR
jgi:hypothetical protein